MKLNSELFIPKFGGWWRYMKNFVESEKMYSIYQKLKEYKKKGISIYPTSENTFKAFEKCSPDILKVIIMGMEPYSGVYSDGSCQATGVCLDNSNNKEGNCQPSLIAFHNGIANEYGIELDCQNDLSYLCEQGVLLLNRSFTVRHKQIGEHIGLWDDFHEYFLRIIGDYFTGIPIILMGNDAHELEKWIFPLSNPVFKLEHPSYAARQQRPWKTDNTFKKINEMLYKNNKESICWHYKLYKEELPF